LTNSFEKKRAVSGFAIWDKNPNAIAVPKWNGRVPPNQDKIQPS